MVTADIVRQRPFFFFGFKREEVMGKDYRRLDSLLAALDEAGRDARGKLMLIFAFGEDPRELCEIPEVNEYLQEIVRRCAHFFYYIMPNMDVVHPFALSLAGAYVLFTDPDSRSAQVRIRDMSSAKETIEQILNDADQYAHSVEDYEGMGELWQVIRACGLPV